MTYHVMRYEPREPSMNSAVKKRSVVLHGHKTSVSLEDDFWVALNDIAAEKGVSVPSLIEQIDAEQEHVNLSSALRVFVFRHYCNAWQKTRARTGERNEATNLAERQVS